MLHLKHTAYFILKHNRLLKFAMRLSTYLKILVLSFSDVEAVAALIKRFLVLEELHQQFAQDDFPNEDEDFEDLGDSSDSKDEADL